MERESAPSRIDGQQPVRSSSRRLDLAQGECRALLASAELGERRSRTLCLLVHTGCPISDALALTAQRVDLEGRALGFGTLEKRRSGVYRAVSKASGGK